MYRSLPTSPIFKRAFTLIELMLSMMVLGILLLVIFQAFFAGFDIFHGETARTDNLAEANRIMEWLEKDLRGAREIQVATPTMVTFWWQDENSNATSEASEEISYSWSGVVGGDITRAKGTDSRIVAKNINNLTFTYDSATLSAIRLITATVTVKTEDETVTLQSTIRPRNL